MAREIAVTNAIISNVNNNSDPWANFAYQAKLGGSACSEGGKRAALKAPSQESRCRAGSVSDTTGHA